MKVKGISFFELHAEKFVLGLAVLILVAVIALQFLGGGSTVRVDNREVGVGEVNGLLRQRAQQLADRLRDDAPSGVDLFEGEVPLVVESFREDMTAPLLDAGGLAPSRPSLASALVPSDIAEVVWYYEPRFSGVAMGEIVQTADALTEEGWQQLQPLGGRFDGAVGELDVTWISPSAVVDLAALREELQRSQPRASPARQAVPSLWFNERLYLVDVVFERQELANGQWGESVVVPAFPTQDSFRADAATADAALRDAMFEELSQAARQLEILQPEFVATRNSNFVAPLPVEATAPSDAAAPAVSDEVRRLRRELQRLRQDEARTKSRLDELGGPVRDDEQKPGDRPSGRGGGRDAGDGGAGGGGGTAPPRGGGLGSGSGMQGRRGTGDAAQDEATKRRRIALTKRLETIATSISRTESDLSKVAPGLASGGAAVALPSMDKDPSIVVWTHDLGVEPNRTYRYRARIDVYNPFFARTNQMVPQQQSLASGFTLGTAFSDWSAPVQVSPPVGFFLTRATPGEGSLGLGTATIEVFAFRDGLRRSATFSVQPGDVIGGVESVRRAGQPDAQIDFSTGWYVMDIIEDPSRDQVSGNERTRGVVVLVGRLGAIDREERFPESDRGNPLRRKFADEVEAAKQDESTGG